ncbi:MAG: hypothetical protein JW741_26430 [Sedimentisphaerales bacterium]|nr:hypothetical protein [Sedimentisphaerales bacterium]
MPKARQNRWIAVLLIAALMVSLCGGCSGLKSHKIYQAALCGAAIGAIIGHQSDECENGALLGAAVFAVGDLLSQMDDLSEKKLEEAAEEVAKGNPLPTRGYPDQPY